MLACKQVGEWRRTIGLRTKWKAMLEIAHLIVFDLQLSGLDCVAQRLAEHWQEHLSAQIFIFGIPVDIEVGRVAALRTMAKYIGPPRIGGHGRHMVRAESDDQAD